ncbi:MAG TPA: hypothetical protein VIJ25_15170 [Methylococcales bacterium]
MPGININGKRIFQQAHPQLALMNILLDIGSWITRASLPVKLFNNTAEPNSSPPYPSPKNASVRESNSNYLILKKTYPAQLMYQELADMACERITAAITRSLVGNRPIKAVLDPYNPDGSTAHVNFNTSKTERW